MIGLQKVGLHRKQGAIDNGADTVQEYRMTGAP